MKKLNLKRSLIVILIALVSSVIVFILIILGRPNTQENENQNITFQKEYEAYLKASKIDNEESPVRSSSLGPRGFKHMHNIAKMGPTVLPDLIEKLENTGDLGLNFPIILITKKSFLRSEWPQGRYGDSTTEAKLFIEWWSTGRKQTTQYFAERYSKWKKLREQGNEKESEAKEELENIRALGIAALPMIIEKVEKGDKELIPIVSKLTDSQVEENASIPQCTAWWRDNKQKWFIPFPN
jgi:hypothetical protein